MTQKLLLILSIGECYLMTGRIDDAKTVTYNALSKAKDFMGYKQMAEIWQQSDNQDSIAYYYKKAYELNKTDPTTLAFLCEYFTSNKKYDKAVLIWKQLQEISNLNSGQYQDFGVCYYRTGKPDKAIQLYEKAYLVDNDNCVVLQNCFLILREMKRKPFANEPFTHALAYTKCDLSQFFTGFGIKYYK